MLLWTLDHADHQRWRRLFVSTSRFITQIKCPLTVFLMQTICRNLIVAAHNATIYLSSPCSWRSFPVRASCCGRWASSWSLICLSWIALVAAVISARYRDVPLMIQNILNILFWFTPLMYFPEQLGQQTVLADYNPFTHMIALMREPLLGGTPSLNDWLVVLALAVFGWARHVPVFRPLPRPHRLLALGPRCSLSSAKTSTSNFRSMTTICGR